ncbi:hypothetical protein [Psychroserpens algicola]|uniref:YD repeat-containing protein n=1 Tax=Psychroserpens algicola TaxID=1719034 RepID=A0ABT0H6I0_9FLAO|nr:hypothetical protein [Psychroserpens algicola]MCK8479787.1 hypothetical protein [Psychroserpens algicola]
MRKLLLAFTCLLILLNLGSCIDKEKKTSLVNNEGKKKTIWVSEKRWDGNIWKNHKRISNTYSKSGDLAEVLFEFNDGEIWNNDFKIEYINDSLGREIVYKVTVWKDSLWQNSYKYLTFYNGENKSLILNFIPDSISWKLSSSTVFYYVTDSLRSMESYTLTEGQWQHSYSNIYDYSGNTEINVGYNVDDGKTEKNYKTISTYNDKGKKLKDQYYSYINENEQIRTITEYTYNDKAGLEIRITKRVFSQDSIVDFSKNILHYDKNTSCTLDYCSH